MIDHMGIDVRDLQKSKKFYEDVLPALGFKLLVYFEEYGAVGFGKDRPRFWLGKGKPTNGDDDVHICFEAQNRKQVRDFYEAAIRAGGRDNGKPGLRPEYHENYYGAFVLDPDGNGIEACCHKSE